MFGKKKLSLFAFTHSVISTNANIKLIRKNASAPECMCEVRDYVNGRWLTALHSILNIFIHHTNTTSGEGKSRGKIKITAEIIISLWNPGVGFEVGINCWFHIRWYMCRIGSLSHLTHSFGLWIGRVLLNWTKRPEVKQLGSCWFRLDDHDAELMALNRV